MKAADKRKQEQLLNLYPDKTIVGFRENHNSLYQMTFFLAKRRKKTVREYVEWLGFDYVDRRIIDEGELKDKLNSLYPNKVISRIANDSANASLYQAILNCSRKHNMTCKQFLNYLGFDYVDKRYKDEFQDIDNLLIDKYPNGKIKSFDDRPLYLKLFRLAKADGKTLSEYLYERGFEYESSRKPIEQVVEQTMLEKLLSMYPDRVVKHLSQENAPLYIKVKKFAYSKNMTLTEYLDSVGFEYVGGRNVVKELVETY